MWLTQPMFCLGLTLPHPFGAPGNHPLITRENGLERMRDLIFCEVPAWAIDEAGRGGWRHF